MQVLVVLLNDDVLCAFNLPNAQRDPQIVELIRNRVREHVAKEVKARAAESRFPEPFKVRIQTCDAIDIKPQYGTTYTESLLASILDKLDS